MASQSYNEVVRKLLALEKEKNFFDVAVRGTPIWERTRSLLSRQILKEYGTVDKAHWRPTTDTSRWYRYYEVLRSALLTGLTNNPCQMESRQLFVWGHERRKQLEDDQWWDIYTDPLYEELDLDYVHFEREYNGEHRQPAKTAEVYDIEVIEDYARVLRKLGCGPDIRPQEIEPVRQMERSIRAEFGVDPEVAAGLAWTFEVERVKRLVYRSYLQRIDPDVAVVVVSYGKEPFILECKNLGIPVAELQHGVIYPHHLAYSYPGDRTKAAFPDYLLVWGEFWREHTEFPIPDERVIPVGYPYLDQRVEQYAGVESENKLLFISQGTIGEQLSKFALEVADHPDIEYEVVYKLHPGEYDRWREEYPWLVDADFQVVDSSDPPLYRLFAESTAQVGVGSTAVYEGLAFELETVVYNCPGVEKLQPLVNEGTAEQVTSADDLAAVLGSGGVSFDRERLFASGATERMDEVLERLQREGSTYRNERTR